MVPAMAAMAGTEGRTASAVTATAAVTGGGSATGAARCRSERAQLTARLEAHGWDGAWYRRAYFDDGTPLGSASSPECQIDSIAQSWSVLSGVAAPDRARRAMDAEQFSAAVGAFRVIAEIGGILRAPIKPPEARP